MTGGLLQLKAYGTENIYLNSNPQISFFRSIFRRHTNFSLENFEINYNGTPNLTEDLSTTYTFNIKRYADLLGPIFVVVKLPAIFSSTEQQFRWIKNIGSNIIQSATLFIAGQRICMLEGHTINNYYRLQKNYPANLNYNELIGHSPSLYYPTMIDPTTNQLTYKFAPPEKTSPSINETHLHIPIPFYFTGNSGLYIPLIALQKAEVQIVIELRKINELYTIVENRRTKPLYNKRVKPNFIDSTQSLLNFTKETVLKQAFTIHLDCQYVFLDNNERAQFADLPHEYLMEQVQYKKFFGITDHVIFDIPFFHPTKEIRFFFRKTDNGILFNQHTNYGNNDYYGEKYLEGALNSAEYRDELTLNYIRTQLSENYENAAISILKTARFIMNGQDRTRNFNERYWNLLQPFQYHLGSTVYPFQENDNMYCFSFSLEPDNFQPSGSCNMTNLKNFQIDIQTVLPPVQNFIILAHYILEFDNFSYDNSWRNPNYSSLNTINNVFYRFFEFYSLQTYKGSTNTGCVYGSYQMNQTANGNNVLQTYNVKIEPVQYVLNANGTIQNNTITHAPNCKMYFYNANDDYYTSNILVLNMVKVELYFFYSGQPIQNDVSLLFLNLNSPINSFDTYQTTIDRQTYNTFINFIPTMVQFYSSIFKTIDQILSEQIMKEMRTVITDIYVNKTEEEIYENILNLTTIDLVNSKIYGVFNLIQKKTINTNGISQVLITNTKYLVYFIYSNIYINSSDNKQTTYTVPLTNCTMFAFLESDYSLSSPIPNFPNVLQNYSLIIFRINKLSNNNPNNLKNYLWSYDLFVEAHNYNLLRISDGTGAEAYST
jgi:hypothetical protein